MIDYDKPESDRNERFFSYFSVDGSWGDASDIVIVDVSELDGHYSDFIEELKDWERPDFMRWYVENQLHDQQQGDYTACEICERWQSGTEDEIQEELEEGNE
jgi:hypothetical protein